MCNLDEPWVVVVCVWERWERGEEGGVVVVVVVVVVLTACE